MRDIICDPVGDLGGCPNVNVIFGGHFNVLLTKKPARIESSARTPPTGRN